ncbi:hypothetical protein [Paraburkholderia acidiphila]|uniref:Uncharacterized protein n=1 Tax=Paraburkholderia acidiphila TaxID=2571747 RepID=A0A7Z2G8I6_9BURK|nr:hypothetical protein [Paraburkholderia acidiphila]QGZ57177.1 hypothetical protein FAZ97_19820 [Paraburkholderia acidiphila]
MSDTVADTTFTAHGLQCRVFLDHERLPAGVVCVPKTHPLYGKRRDVQIIVPKVLAGRPLNAARLATADFHGVIPAAFSEGDAAPLSAAVDVPGGVWNTGRLNDDVDLWCFSFRTDADANEDQVRAETEAFAQQLAALADVKLA